MSGPTLQQRLDLLTEHLDEAQRRYAAGEPYPDHVGGTWPERIAKIKQHIADLKAIIANE